MAPQGAAAHFSTLSCVASGHRLSRLNHARRWCGAGSPAVHPVWDQRGPGQESRPPRISLGTSTETQPPRASRVGGGSSPRASRGQVGGAGGWGGQVVWLIQRCCPLGLDIFPQACGPWGELLFRVSC